MLFTEFSFIFIFLPITLGVFWALSRSQMQLIALIVASLAFYSVWNIYFLPMLIGSVLVSYFFAVQLHRTGNKVWFYIGLIASLIPIIYFKYSGMIVNTVGIDAETGLFGERYGSLLPLGISF